VRGHALAAEQGIATLFRRVYHNPDGYERANEFDFVSYFECDDEAIARVRSGDEFTPRPSPEPRMALRRRRSDLARTPRAALVINAPPL
jgi:hypothetical protein